MNATTNQWLDKSLRLPGVLAAATYRSDSAVTVQSLSPDFEPPAIEHAVKCAADVFAVLRFQQLPAEWLRWEFEKASFYCVCRNDQRGLGLFISKDPRQVNAAEIERFLTEFSHSGGEK